MAPTHDLIELYECELNLIDLQIPTLKTNTQFIMSSGDVTSIFPILLDYSVYNKKSFFKINKNYDKKEKIKEKKKRKGGRCLANT